MTRRFTVMGFTEAELGFVLAAVFAALAVSGLSAQPKENLAAKNDTLAHRVGHASGHVRSQGAHHGLDQVRHYHASMLG